MALKDVKSDFLLVLTRMMNVRCVFCRIDINSEDPQFVGAWWLGFLISSSGFLTIALMLFLFGRELPGKLVDRCAQTLFEAGSRHPWRKLVPPLTLLASHRKLLPPYYMDSYQDNMPNVMFKHLILYNSPNWVYLCLKLLSVNQSGNQLSVRLG